MDITAFPVDLQRLILGDALESRSAFLPLRLVSKRWRDALKALPICCTVPDRVGISDAQNDKPPSFNDFRALVQHCGFRCFSQLLMSKFVHKTPDVLEELRKILVEIRYVERFSLPKPLSSEFYEVVMQCEWRRRLRSLTISRKDEWNYSEQEASLAPPASCRFSHDVFPVLEKLHLEDYCLTPLLNDLCTLTTLVHLYFINVMICGGQTAQLASSLPRLQKLGMRGKFVCLTREDVAAVSLHPKLHKFSVRQEQFGNRYDADENNTARSIFIDSNDLKLLTSLRTLKSLSLPVSLHTNKGISLLLCFSSLKSLKTLDIEAPQKDDLLETQIAATTIRSLGITLPQLRKCSLSRLLTSRHELEADLLRSFAEFSGLRELEIGAPYSSQGTVDFDADAFHSLTRLRNLTKLSLNGPFDTDTEVCTQTIAMFTQLKELDFYKTFSSLGVPYENISTLSSLTELCLPYSNIESYQLQSILRNSPLLKKLRMDYCEKLGSLDCICNENVPHLRYLTLRACTQLRDVHLTSVTSLKKLETLNVYQTGVGGECLLGSRSADLLSDLSILGSQFFSFDRVRTTPLSVSLQGAKAIAQFRHLKSFISDWKLPSEYFPVLFYQGCSYESVRLVQATLEDLSHLVVCKQLRMLRVTEPAKPKGSNQSDTNNSNNNTTKNSTANMNTNITTNSNTSISVNTIAASNTNSAASSTTNVNNSTNAVAASNSKSTIASTESTKKSSTASAATSSSSSTTAAKAKFTSENFLENVRAFFSQLPRLNRLHVDSDKEKVFKGLLPYATGDISTFAGVPLTALGFEKIRFRYTTNHT